MDQKHQKKFQYAQITDVGCVRELNEDTVFVSDNLWLVADGMGGHACGEVASQIAAKSIPELISQGISLGDSINRAHKDIIEAANQGTGHFGMGTTVVALSSSDEQYELAWVGDSRAYLWDGNKGKISQISEDHSLMVRLIKSGLISEEDAKQHPQRHMITQCLGSMDLEELDVAVRQGQWHAREQILLCSDGLSDDVSEDQLSGVLKLDLSNQQKLAKLTEMAKDAGGKDNISIVLIDSPVNKAPSLWLKLKSLISS